MQFEFSGLDELIQELDRIENITPELKDKALVEGGEVLLKRMKDEVYRHGLHRRSGIGQDSLTRTDPQNEELFVGTQGGRRQLGFYLYMQEFGFYNVRARRFIPPKPFASIAFDLAKPKILDAYVDVFRKGMGMK